MASFELTVDDSSPLINYTPAGSWSDSPPGAPLLSSYFDSSLHTTTLSNANATITFNGTGITFFGGMMPTYGTYTFSVDGSVVVDRSANSPTPLTNQLLGSVSGLTNGLHTATITNTGPAIDIDWIQLQTRMGPQGIVLKNTTIDDADPRVTYGPSISDWTLENETTSIDNTIHFSTTDGAFVSFTFTGGAVAVYGTVSPTHSDVQISLDGESSSFSCGSNGSASQLHSPALLYYRSNIGNSLTHTLTMSADPQSVNPGYIDIDAFIVFSASNTTLHSTTHIPGPTGISNPSQSSPDLNLHSTIIIAVSVTLGVLFVFAFIIIGFYLLRRRRRQRQIEEEEDGVMNRSNPSPVLPIQRPKLMEDGFGPGFGTTFDFPGGFEFELPGAASGMREENGSVMSSSSDAPMLGSRASRAPRQSVVRVKEPIPTTPTPRPRQKTRLSVPESVVSVSVY